jgi:hypothetical protein
MATIRELDTVALRRPYGRWLAGTTGAVLETLNDRAALVELVGPDGRSLDVFTVLLADLELVRRTGSHDGPEPDRPAG